MRLEFSYEFAYVRLDEDERRRLQAACDRHGEPMFTNPAVVVDLLHAPLAAAGFDLKVSPVTHVDGLKEWTAVIHPTGEPQYSFWASAAAGRWESVVGDLVEYGSATFYRRNATCPRETDLGPLDLSRLA